MTYIKKTEAVHDAVMKAGAKSGLKMTEFKSNAIIAEKADGDSSASATVTFTNDKVIIMDESGDIDAEDLLEAIEEELQSEGSH
jgi:glycine cleavage system protein P-like pyridoxal-binding family